MKVVIDMPVHEEPIPPEYKPHKLIGEYRGCMDCHIQGDSLLTWIDEATSIIELVRMGSHSELFG